MYLVEATPHLRGPEGPRLELVRRSPRAFDVEEQKSQAEFEQLT